MAGWYELSKSANSQFNFVLKAGNGEVILRGEQYATKASAEGGIASVQSNCHIDARYERKASADGKPYFNVKAANGQVVGTSQMYGSDDSRASGIAAVKASGGSRSVKDLTAD
jgi:uncharacterized protein YegP (UPF0339 family)